MFSFPTKPIKVLAAVLILLTAMPGAGKAKIPENAGLLSWSALIPHPLEENKFLAAAHDSIYVTASGVQDQWQKWSALPSKGLEILKLFSFPRRPENLFVLTDNGLYETSLTDPRYKTIYKKTNLDEEITDFALDPENPDRLFLGTSTGVLESKDRGRSWHSFSAAGRGPVCFLRFSNQSFFVARPNQLLVSKNDSRFQSVFFSAEWEAPDSAPASNQSFSGETTEEDTLSSSQCSLRDFAGTGSLPFLWLATSRGVFESKNGGLTWTKAPSGGLLTQDIHHLVQDPKTQRVFASSLNQVYEFSSLKNHWREIPLQTGAASILALSSGGGNLKIVTAAGLLTYVILPDGIRSPDAGDAVRAGKALFQDLLRQEPTALQIQRVVSRYHHTQNSKINRWQAESRLRALLPTVSFKKDFSWANNIDLDRGSTNDADKFIDGPADTSRGWDFGVAWDLGDFIFSTSQTSIDSREKLMMELRHDLLSEATRLFYERRRIQMETVLRPASSEEEHLARLFQIDELTALLDGMTNGFMSRQIELIYKNRPEFAVLWEYPEEHRTLDIGHKGTREKP